MCLATRLAKKWKEEDIGLCLIRGIVVLVDVVGQGKQAPNRKDVEVITIGRRSVKYYRKIWNNVDIIGNPTIHKKINKEMFNLKMAQPLEF